MPRQMHTYFQNDALGPWLDARGWDLCVGRTCGGVIGKCRVAGAFRRAADRALLRLRRRPLRESRRCDLRDPTRFGKTRHLLHGRHRRDDERPDLDGDQFTSDRVCVGWKQGNDGTCRKMQRRMRGNLTEPDSRGRQMSRLPQIRPASPLSQGNDWQSDTRR